MVSFVRELPIGRRGISALAVMAIGIALLMLLVAANRSADASAGGVFSALTQPVTAGPNASSDPVLRELEFQNPNLDLTTARAVLSDTEGTVWLARGVNGDICLIERPANTAVGDLDRQVTSRFGCRSQDDAAKEGIVAGVPNHWYGVVPDGFGDPSVRVGDRSLAVAKSGEAFRLPAGATSVTTGSTTYELPH
jgi:hypothetical protein